MMQDGGPWRRHLALSNEGVQKIYARKNFMQLKETLHAVYTGDSYKPKPQRFWNIEA